MTNLQKELDLLQPYILSIRYVEVRMVVDVIFNENWVLPNDANIIKSKGESEAGTSYYMLYGETTDVNLDILLPYIQKIIKLNQEREQKNELLVIKINELKELFKKSSLEDLNKLSFNFNGTSAPLKVEESVPLEIEETLNDLNNINQIVDFADEPIIDIDNNKYVSDFHTEPIIIIDNSTDLSDEDREYLEEEARAERNRKIIQARKQKKNIVKNSVNFELPPKNY